MSIVDHDIFEAVRRGYAALESASSEAIVEYFSSVDGDSVVGHMNHIKGVLFEQEYVQALEAQGIEAAVFESTNHPITDIMVFGGLNDIVEIQLKATDSVSYVTAAMEENPEVIFAVTSEVASKFMPDIVIDAGIENSALDFAVEETLFSETVNPFSAFSILRFLVGIPF